MVSANNHGKNSGAGSMQISGNRRVGLKQGLSVLLLVPLFVFALDREPESQQGVSRGDINCVASPAWVESPSEANAAGFRPNSNCSFHQWAYQNFLWLTSEAGTTGETIFEGFANPTALFVPGGPTLPYPGRATGTAIDMLARFGKSQTTADIEDIFQAGPGNKILVDQHGEVVFYSNHLNETFWNFIVDNALYELPDLQAIPPGTNFPVGALELKAAWRVAEKGGRVLIPNADRRFYVVETSIPTVTVNSQGQVVEDKTRMIRAKMAFIGMHVTGTVRGHPEFIWATFEHVDNAPLCNSVDSLPAATGPGPTGPWSLYAPGTPTRWANQFDVNDPLAVVNVCLVHCRLVSGSLAVRAAPSFILDRLHGTHWLAVGDAASSYDPISSQGIYMALADGLAGGRAIAAHLGGVAGALVEHQDRVEQRFANYERQRANFYKVERRWADASFWSDRSGRA